VRIRQFRAAGLVALATLVAAGAVLPIVGASAAAGGSAGATLADDPAPIPAVTADGLGVDTDDGNVTVVAAGPGQLITGTADAPAGTRVSVRVRSTGDTQPRFLRVAEAVVREDGTWGVAFNFSAQSAGDAFELTAILADSDARVTVDGEVVACEGDCAEGTPASTPTPIPTPTPDESDDEADGRTPVAPPSVGIDADGGTLAVAADEGQLVTGTADAPAGTALRVRVRATGDTEPRFIRTARAVVREDGTWGVAFNFSAQSAGDTFGLTVGTEGGTAATVDGEVVACDGDCVEGTPRPTPTASPTPTAEPDDGTADAPTIASGSVTAVRRGRTAELELAMGDADAATVVIGGREDGYELVATVRDGNGDGRTTLYVDTAAAGRDGATVSVPEGDEVSVSSEVDLDAGLGAGEYDVTVHRGASTDGEALDVGTLAVQRSNTSTPSETGGNANAPDETPSEDATTDATPADGSTLGAFPDWLAAVGAGAVFVLGGAGLAVALLRRD